MEQDDDAFALATHKIFTIVIFARANAAGRGLGTSRMSFDETLDKSFVVRL